jgi:hypothetical protein
MVFGDKAEDKVARLVWSQAGGPGMVMGTVHTSNGMWALVKGVVSLCGPAIVAWQWQLWMWVRHVVWTYLDSRNGVGKIPS